MATRQWSRRHLLKTAGAVTGSAGAAAVLPAGRRALAVAAPARQDDGGTLYYAITSDIKGGLDASQSIEMHTTKVISFRISEPLLKFDFANNQVMPWLAESWEPAPDGASITLRLRQGVQFHDGTPFNADAVAFSINRVLDTAHPFHATGTYPYLSWLGSLQGIETIDEYTVRAVAAAPDPILAWRLTLEPTYIQSPAAIEQFGEDYTNNPSGTGPFSFVEMESGVGVTLDRNPSYWGQPAALERIVYRIIPDLNAAIAELETGNLHIFQATAPTLDTLATISGVSVFKSPSLQYSYWGMNNSKPPLDDINVRRALSHAVDRDARVEVDKGLTEVMPYPWYPGAFGFAEDVRQYPYDPDQARQLLDEAGWVPDDDGVRAKDGTQLDLEILQWLPPGAQPPPAVLLYQQQVREVGVATHFRIIEPGLSFDPAIGLFAGDKTELYPLGWNTPLPDPSFLLDETYSCETRSPDGFNVAQFCDSRVDELLAQARSALDLDQRAGLYQEVQRIVAEAAVLTWGWRVLFAFAMRDNVQDFAVTPIGDPLLERVVLG